MKRFAFLFIVCFVGLASVVAQTTASHTILITIPQIHSVALSDSSEITLTVTSPAAPGNAPTGDSDASKYLRYTVLNPVGVTQQVTAGITLGVLPAGLALSLDASDGTPLGTMGSIATVTGVAAALITGIPSGYTGTGAIDGAMLTYTLTVSDAALLEENGGGDSITVTFTILDS